MDPLFDTFKTRAEAVSAEVHRYATRREALTFVLDFLRREGISEAPEYTAVWADCDFLHGLDLSEIAGQVPGLSFAVTREAAATARIGISQLDCAIAATGTLVQDATPVERRLASTLPSIHIALAPTGQIYPDLASILSRLNPASMPYISMITGPSRTADIERVLTIGVHGPSRLVIVFVDELGGRQ